MRPCSVLVLASCGCGRLDFDRAADAADRAADAADRAFGPARLVEGLGTTGSEEDPSLPADMLEIVYARNNALMVATRAAITDPWTTPGVIAELDSPYGETSPEISSDGLVIFFTSDRPGSAGGGDIYVSQRAARGSPWSPPSLVVELNTTAYDLSATTTSDLTFVVFCSERPPGGVGNAELWAAERPTSTRPWGAAVPIAELNSTSDDIAPYFHEPTRTLYFASSRGAPSLDLWRATRKPGGGFDPPARIGELTTTERESDPWVSPDGAVMYFSRDVAGQADLFVAER